MDIVRPASELKILAALEHADLHAESLQLPWLCLAQVGGHQDS